MTTEKIFIGSVKPGNFHNPAEGKIHLKHYISEDDINTIVKYIKSGGAGVWTNSEGKRMLTLEAKTARNGETYYSEISNWQPNGQNGSANAPSEIYQKKKPESAAIPDSEVYSNDDDLPF